MPILPMEAEPATLRDGTPLTIRPIRPDDAPRLQALHSRLSPESVYLRFLDFHPQLSDREAQRFANMDYHSTMAFVAAREEGGEESIVAVARYVAPQRAAPDVAEAAIVVEDCYQARGLGTLLLDRLVAYARAHGIRMLTAEISAGNERMLHFIRRCGMPTEKQFTGGVWEIKVHIN